MLKIKYYPEVNSCPITIKEIVLSTKAELIVVLLYNYNIILKTKNLENTPDTHKTFNCL